MTRQATNYKMDDLRGIVKDAFAAIAIRYPAKCCVGMEWKLRVGERTVLVIPYASRPNATSNDWTDNEHTIVL